MFTSCKDWRVSFIAAMALTLAATFGAAAGAEPVGATAEVSSEDAEVSEAQLRLASKSKEEVRGTKVSGNLRRVHDEYLVKTRARAGEPAEGPQGGMRMATLARVADGRVTIDAIAETATAELADQLKALGFEETASFGRVVSGRLPIEAIPALNDLPALKSAHASYAKAFTGAVTSQGDRAMWSDEARALYGVCGAGVKVGVLSDSFNCLGGYPHDIESGDLPSGVSVLAEGPCDEYAHDEGRALAQIVHDVAPCAALSFHTAFAGIADFAQGILDLADDGAAVMVDDIIWFGEPMFQDGVVAQAVDRVAAGGVTYVSSAGNQAQRSYEAPFRPAMRDGWMTAHDFDPGAKVVTAQTVTIPGWGDFIVSFQWDDPFYSAGGGSGAQSDVDLHFYYQGHYLGSCNDANIGGDAVEMCGIVNEGPVGGSIKMVVELYAGPAPGLIKYVNFGNATVNFATKTGTCFGHANAGGAVAVGAVDYRKTPRFGKKPVLETFSSAGGVPILFDTLGNRLAQPEIRQVPWIAAPDGVDTTFFGSRDPDHTGWPNLFGTSASAPHAAAVAALMREEGPVLTPQAIRGRMAAAAIDMGAAGEDLRSGHGFLDAEFAVGNRPAGHDLTATWQPGTPKQTCKTKNEVTTCSKVSGKLKVSNVGNIASKPTKIAFFLSADATPEPGEQLFVKTLKAKLGRDKSANMPVTVNLSKLTGGASVAGQHLIAVIDPAADAQDPDDNNIAVGIIQ